MEMWWRSWVIFGGESLEMSDYLVESFSVVQGESIAAKSRGAGSTGKSGVKLSISIDFPVILGFRPFSSQSRDSL
jgi:hypothetical protein